MGCGFCLVGDLHNFHLGKKVDQNLDKRFGFFIAFLSILSFYDLLLLGDFFLNKTMSEEIKVSCIWQYRATASVDRGWRI